MVLLVRVFAPAPDPGGAEVIGGRLLAALDGFAATPAMAPERYWKVPAWYEHTVHLVPATEATFDLVLARAASGWHQVSRDGECSAVWNATPGAVFLLPEVTWAEVLLIHEPVPPRHSDGRTPRS